MKGYSRPAIAFQASIRRAALFRVYNDISLTHLKGKTLLVRDVLKATKNPDDYLYDVEDEDGNHHEVRSWWLRRCTERVD